MNGKKYFYTENKTFATTMAYLLSRKLFVMNNPDGTIYYSFIRDEEFDKVFDFVSRTRKKNSIKNIKE